MFYLLRRLGQREKEIAGSYSVFEGVTMGDNAMDNMTEMEKLLKEADELGILNIDLSGGELSPEILQIALNAVKGLDSRLDQNKIRENLQRVDHILAQQK